MLRCILLERNLGKAFIKIKGLRRYDTEEKKRMKLCINFYKNTINYAFLFLRENVIISSSIQCLMYTE